MRDLKGYGRTPPNPDWPGGARVAVSFVLNFEEGAEMSLAAGDAFNEKVYEVTDEVTGVADRCMETHFEYGTKVAWWRIADTLERLGVPATVTSVDGIQVRADIGMNNNGGTNQLCVELSSDAGATCTIAKAQTLTGVSPIMTHTVGATNDL